MGSGGFWGGGYGGVRLPGDGIESILPARRPLAVGAFCSMESRCTRIDVLDTSHSYEAYGSSVPVGLKIVRAEEGRGRGGPRSWISGSYMDESDCVFSIT